MTISWQFLKHTLEGGPLIVGRVNFPPGHLNSFYELSLGLWDCGRITDTLRGMPRSHLFPGVERGLTRVSGNVVFSQDPEPLGRLIASYKLLVTVPGWLYDDLPGPWLFMFLTPGHLDVFPLSYQ